MPAVAGVHREMGQYGSYKGTNECLLLQAAIEILNIQIEL